VSTGDGDIVARGYDKVAGEYEALESDDAPWPRLQRVRSFVADLPRDSRVLDIGCGNGLPATQELAQRHQVVRVDISPEQIARAKANVPGATFSCGDVRTVDLADESFDAIVALYLLDNVPSDDYPALFAKLARCLKPGGRLLLSSEPGDDPGQAYEWLGVPMFINTIPTRELIELIEAAGLKVTGTDNESQLEGGRPIDYAWITVTCPAAIT
jgi:cyclopropane fatty-acyl-phospholipid synthase-like methyltransferase